MLKLLNLFFEVAILRRPPQDVPYDLRLLRLALAAYVGSGMLVLFLRTAPDAALILAAVDLMLLTAMLTLVLNLAELKERLVQTLTALTGAWALIQLVAWPVINWLARAEAAAQGQGLPLLLVLLIMIWSIAVLAHILRHALSGPWVQGVILAIIYTMMSQFVTGSVERLMG